MKTPSYLKPVHRHDCEKCKYLATLTTHDGVADWYTCGKTILARFSDEGPDYWSMERSMVTNDNYLVIRNIDTQQYALNEMHIIARWLLENIK